MHRQEGRVLWCCEPQIACFLPPKGQPGVQISRRTAQYQQLCYRLLDREPPPNIRSRPMSELDEEGFLGPRNMENEEET